MRTYVSMAPKAHQYGKNMNIELDQKLIDEIESIHIPKLFRVMYDGSREPRFSISYPEKIETDMVEHVIVDHRTGANTVFMRQTLAEEIQSSQI